MIIVGSKTKGFGFPRPTHSSENGNATLFGNSLVKHITLGEAISDLPLIKSGEESFAYASNPQNQYQQQMRNNSSKMLIDHNAPNNNENLVKLMDVLPDGGTPMDLPESLRPKSGFANTYCKLWWNRPSTTITRNLSTPSSSRCIHPKASRPLTTREGARLQSFPDNYVFYGSRSDKNLQIGNAVPPLLSVALKGAIKTHFEAIKAQRELEVSNIIVKNTNKKLSA